MFKRKRIKEPYIVVMTFLKETLAEIAKNYLKEEFILSKMISKCKLSFDVRDFMYLFYINDRNKTFKVIFQYNTTGSEKEILRLRELISKVFECRNYEIENKKDFNFEKYNLGSGLAKDNIIINSDPSMNNPRHQANQHVDVSPIYYASNNMNFNNHSINHPNQTIQQPNQSFDYDASTMTINNGIYNNNSVYDMSQMPNNNKFLNDKNQQTNQMSKNDYDVYANIYDKGKNENISNNEESKSKQQTIFDANEKNNLNDNENKESEKNEKDDPFENSLAYFDIEEHKTDFLEENEKNNEEKKKNIISNVPEK